MMMATVAFRKFCEDDSKLDKGKDKGKVHPRTGHQGPEGD
jgi:hypothetical protein